MSSPSRPYPFSRWVKPANVPKLTRDNDLDMLRLLLAACVVFIHSKAILGGLDFAYARTSAVPVFLFISGLLITESFYGSESFKTYGEKRVRRIYPAYLAVVIFGGAIAFLGWTFLGGQNISALNLFKYWGSNAVFANWFAPCVTDPSLAIKDCTVNGSLWIMKWEVVFYATLPAMLIIFSRLSKYLSLLCLAILTYLVSVETSPYLRIFECFLMGICAYYLKPLWMTPLKALPPAPPLLRTVAIILAFPLGQYISYGPFILLLMLIAFYPTSEGWRLNTLKFGDVSYGIFLIHFPLITAIFQFMPSSIFGPWVSFIVLGTASLLSMVMYKFIEKPFLLPSSHYRNAAKAP